ncbi:MAG: DUF6034 family protein [Eubacteriales bacterium]|nr:DUF6034 family protein [Eubacteriales bacterium]
MRRKTTRQKTTRQKAIAGICGLLFALGTLAGCAETPESTLVKQKGKASLSNYEEGEALNGEETSDEETSDGETSAEKTSNEETSKLRNLLGAPETYHSEIKDATGRLKVFTDASVEIPDATQVSAISVSQHPFTQEDMKTIVDIFCPDAKIYSSDSYHTMTKGDYRKLIEELKGYVSEGNLDPYDQGYDDDGNLFFDIYETIAELEEEYQKAPDERTLVEVPVQYGLSADDGGGEKKIMEDSFAGVACLPDGTDYDISISSRGATPMNVFISKIPDGANREEGCVWSDYKDLKANYGDVPEEEELKELIGISLEEAKQIADEKVEKLNLPYMEMTDWEYGVSWWEAAHFTRDAIDEAGYTLHYTRKLNGIPITYDKAFGGAVTSSEEEIGGETETWGIEFLDINVTKNGISSVKFIDQYDIGDVKTKNVKLMSFPEIMEIYEKMMIVKNADVFNYAQSVTFRIDRIVFGYCRIYEPSTDSTTGLLVPVWDFFGEETPVYDDENKFEEGFVEGMTEYKSCLTVNAIDGSIINRNVGY